jgi:hypothetical protein
MPLSLENSGGVTSPGISESVGLGGVYGGREFNEADIIRVEAGRFENSGLYCWALYEDRGESPMDYV